MSTVHGTCKVGIPRIKKKTASGSLFLTTAQPPTMVCKMKAQAQWLHFAHTLLQAQLGLVDKISASELSRKFIKTALLVGCGWTGKWLSLSRG